MIEKEGNNNNKKLREKVWVRDDRNGIRSDFPRMETVASRLGHLPNFISPFSPSSTAISIVSGPESGSEGSPADPSVVLLDPVPSDGVGEDKVFSPVGYGLIVLLLDGQNDDEDEEGGSVEARWKCASGFDDGPLTVRDDDDDVKLKRIKDPRIMKRSAEKTALLNLDLLMMMSDASLDVTILDELHAVSSEKCLLVSRDLEKRL